MLIESGAEYYGIKSGWWRVEGDWYVTFGQAKKELHLSKTKMEKLLSERKVRTQTLENSHNGRNFTVYHSEDLGIEEECSKPH